MGGIRVLDDHLVNRIAAGEVVERPSSVVKELVENSLDAGASSIEVTLSAGGKRLIRVRDDGRGMDRDDAVLAIERHATSKLRRFEDLGAIATLGFRGEALPSIASVARCRLTTADSDGAGTEVVIRGGTILSVTDCGPPRGTEVEVADLFFNVPARRKFLRSDPTELAHAVRVVGLCALAHPSVRFRLAHEGRTLLETPPAAARSDRIASVHGVEFLRRLVPFRHEGPHAAIEGFAGRPVDASRRRDHQLLFVNGRAVRDRVLSHAVAETYADAVPRGLHPPVLLFVEVPPDEVDVNVHPQKSEVRFARSSAVHDAVREVMAAALGTSVAIPSFSELRPASAEDAGGGGTAFSRLAEPAPSLTLATRDQEGGGTRVATPLAQYRDSYIVAQDREGLLLVDQHVAHERVLFERYLSDAQADSVEIQRLLVPLTVELPGDGIVRLLEEKIEFRRLGFVLERFGEDVVRVDGVPAFAADADPARLLRELVGEAGRATTAAEGDASLRRRLVTTAACQAAVKVNYPLAHEAMQRLLDDLFRTQNPTTCPHGRPILFRLTLDAIERAFRRR